MVKKKFKLTTAINKSLITLAATYPEMVMTDANNKPMYRKGHIKCFWEDLTPEDQKRLGPEKMVPVYKYNRNGHKVVDFMKKPHYVTPTKELLIVNHYLNLVAAYEKKGIEGVQAYTDQINLYVVAAQTPEFKTDLNEQTENEKNIDIDPAKDAAANG